MTCWMCWNFQDWFRTGSRELYEQSQYFNTEAERNLSLCVVSWIKVCIDIWNYKLEIFLRSGILSKWISTNWSLSLRFCSWSNARLCKASCTTVNLFWHPSGFKLSCWHPGLFSIPTCEKQPGLWVVMLRQFRCFDGSYGTNLIQLTLEITWKASIIVFWNFSSVENEEPNSKQLIQPSQR